MSLLAGKRNLSLFLVGCGLVSLYATTQQWMDSQAERQLASQPTSDSRTERKSCYVLTVYDGDTLGCDLNNNHRVDPPEEQIRLLGIDTPERHYSKKNKTGVDAPMSVEASQFTEAQALHRTIYLESDLKTHDRYGRSLAYVYLSADAEDTLNEALLKNGLAKMLFIPPNEMHIQAFYKAYDLWKASRQK